MLRGWSQSTRQINLPRVWPSHGGGSQTTVKLEEVLPLLESTNLAPATLKESVLEISRSYSRYAYNDSGCDDGHR
jgi:hypothetical protein